MQLFLRNLELMRYSSDFSENCFKVAPEHHEEQNVEQQDEDYFDDRVLDDTWKRDLILAFLIFRSAPASKMK